MTTTDNKHSHDKAGGPGKAPAPGKARAKAANGKFIKSPAAPEAGKQAAATGEPRGNSRFPPAS